MKPTAFGHRIIALIAAFFLVSTCLQANAAAVSHVYTIEDTNSYINITGGEKFIVSLRETGSYLWNLTNSYSSALQLVDQGRYSLNPGIPGSAMIRNWAFQGDIKSNATISLVYWQPWVGNASIINNFTLHVNVTSDAPINPVWIYVIVLSVIIVVPTAVILKWMKSIEKESK